MWGNILGQILTHSLIRMEPKVLELRATTGVRFYLRAWDNGEGEVILDKGIWRRLKPKRPRDLFVWDPDYSDSTHVIQMETGDVGEVPAIVSYVTMAKCPLWRQRISTKSTAGLELAILTEAKDFAEAQTTLCTYALSAKCISSEQCYLFLSE